MCNCGKKRLDLNKQTLPDIQKPFTTALISDPANIKFQYKGNSSLSIIGNITGRQYRFRQPGDIQEVYNDDVIFMIGVPGLIKYQNL